MAARLGLLPWEREKLTPAELKELWEARVYMRSRDMEMMANCVLWLMKGFGASEVDFDNIVASMPGYDQGRKKMFVEMGGGVEPPWMI